LQKVSYKKRRLSQIFYAIFIVSPKFHKDLLAFQTNRGFID